MRGEKVKGWEQKGREVREMGRKKKGREETERGRKKNVEIRKIWSKWRKNYENYLSLPFISPSSSLLHLFPPLPSPHRWRTPLKGVIKGSYGRLHLPSDWLRSKKVLKADWPTRWPWFPVLVMFCQLIFYSFYFFHFSFF